LPIDKLTDACAKFIGKTAKEVASTLESLKLEGSLIFQIFQEKEFAFLPELYHCESYAAQRLAMMLKFPAQSIIGIKSLIENIENSEGIKYAARQIEAIESALNKGLLVLTGGPGTGKTTTLNAIIKILKQKGEKIYLAAPTGRAAQRMTEVTGEEAKTIHRLLEVEWNPENKQVFRRNEKNLLKCDTLILDEFSMVDSFMFDAILRSLPLSCRLIMVGDENQLPSVGAGNILGDIIHSAKVPTIHLNEIFRQSLKSLIITNAHRIVNGIMPELAIRNNDFFFLEMQDSKHIINTVLDLCCNRLPKTYAYSPLFDIQVLCPGRKGPLGTNELNKELQQVLNPSSKAATQEHRFSWANSNKEYKKEINIGEITLREGDKVMQTRNNYDIPFVRSDGSNSQGVFNGDIGILTKIDKQNNSFSVKFDDKQALYDIDNAIDLELAYSITIHKSQGSEFEAVIIPIFHGPPQLYFRNLLYTAVTRAKSMLILVGIRDIVAKMVENDKKTKRYSGLYHTLMET
jgi:exodeoxyribonuclease V alpha subunit